MVATTACSEGVNLEVGHVIHYGGSFDLISYFQQAGRAGRDGSPCTSLSILQRRELARLRTSGREDMVCFLETVECRRKVLAAHFDGRLVPGCRAPDQLCDNCDPDNGVSIIEDYISQKPRTAFPRTDTPKDLTWA